MTLPASSPRGVGVDNTAPADVGAADGGAAEAVDPPPEAHPLSNPVTATSAKAPVAFGPERII
jgi:hypothetical protein